MRITAFGFSKEDVDRLRVADFNEYPNGFTSNRLKEGADTDGVHANEITRRILQVRMVLGLRSTSGIE